MNLSPLISFYRGSNMERRKFIKSSSLILIGFVASSKLKAADIFSDAVNTVTQYKKRILAIINTLRKEGSNLVRKIMNGRKYEYDPYVHYPYEGGIKDGKTGCQLFFHIHRENEYGHFHTFGTDDAGELVHLILISMNEAGEPIGLATVNRWVTGDKYVKVNVLKKLSDKFYVDPILFKDKRIIEFINYIFKAYKDDIHELLDKRDEWIKNYVNNKFNEPFEDREFEILSSKTLIL
jgi:hypothetical protein